MPLWFWLCSLKNLPSQVLSEKTLASAHTVKVPAILAGQLWQRSRSHHFWRLQTSLGLMQTLCLFHVRLLETGLMGVPWARLNLCQTRGGMWKQAVATSSVWPRLWALTSQVHFAV